MLLPLSSRRQPVMQGKAEKRSNSNSKAAKTPAWRRCSVKRAGSRFRLRRLIKKDCYSKTADMIEKWEWFIVCRCMNLYMASACDQIGIVIIVLILYICFISFHMALSSASWKPDDILHFDLNLRLHGRGCSIRYWITTWLLVPHIQRMMGSFSFICNHLQTKC